MRILRVIVKIVSDNLISGAERVLLGIFCPTVLRKQLKIIVTDLFTDVLSYGDDEKMKLLGICHNNEALCTWVCEAIKINVPYRTLKILPKFTEQQKLSWDDNLALRGAYKQLKNQFISAVGKGRRKYQLLRCAIFIEKWYFDSLRLKLHECVDLGAVSLVRKYAATAPFVVLDEVLGHAKLKNNRNRCIGVIQDVINTILVVVR